MTKDKQEQQALGERLRLILEEFGLTQTAFSQMVGIRQGFVNQVIKGHKRISGSILLTIAIRLKNVSLNWLITGEGQMYLYPNYYDPPQVGSGLPDTVEEKIQMQYGPDDPMQTVRRRLDDVERRLKDLESNA